MIECVENDAETPICPHCNAQLDKVFCRALTSLFGKRFIYFCSNCKKTLGVSHRKGFWMG